MNALKEFLEHTNGKKIKCAFVELDYDPYGDETDTKRYVLPVGYTNVQFVAFCKSLDFDYDDGYGRQEIMGYIWYQDGTWSERYEYDGAEWWVFKSVPAIPKELL